MLLARPHLKPEHKWALIKEKIKYLEDNIN